MKPFLDGKKTVPLTSLRPVASPPSAGPASVRTIVNPAAAGAPAGGGATAPHHAHGRGTATVEAVKEGDKVVRLIVTCACGERIEVQCLYPAPK